jgi:hypothetical protein
MLDRLMQSPNKSVKKPGSRECMSYSSHSRLQQITPANPHRIPVLQKREERHNFYRPLPEISYDSWGNRKRTYPTMSSLVAKQSFILTAM